MNASTLRWREEFDMKRLLRLSAVVVLVASMLAWGSEDRTVAVAEPPYRTLEEPGFGDVRIADEFWAPRIETCREVTLPHAFDVCEETGRISNFVKAAGLMEGKFKGAWFNDSDLYKVLQGAAYELGIKSDPKLDKLVDDTIAKIAAAQQPDG